MNCKSGLMMKKQKHKNKFSEIKCAKLGRYEMEL